MTRLIKCITKPLHSQHNYMKILRKDIFNRYFVLFVFLTFMGQNLPARVRKTEKNKGIA
jgi:hypothetical protein